MGDRSAIEWTDSSFNPWFGCTKISSACDHCYAEAMMDTRLGRVQWGAGNPRRRTSASNWRKPIRWNREPFAECGNCGWRFETGGLAMVCAACIAAGRSGRNVSPARRRVFCASLADVFDNEVDPQWRADLFDLIRSTPNLDWLLLTKRIGNAAAMVAEARDTAHAAGNRDLVHWLQCWIDGRAPFNVWLGATICNQAEADRDIPKLLATPARVRFLSIEPMIGPINLNRVRDPNFRVLGSALNGAGYQSRIDWVIAGGESGAHARPSHPDWFRSLRDQCAEADVPFLFKQWGEWLPVDADGDLPTIAQDGSDRPLPGTTPIDTTFGLSNLVGRIGKKAAGRLLDGRTHDGFPLTLQAGGDRAG